MSDDNQIGRRYARALLELSSDADAADVVERDLEALTGLLTSGGGELFEALRNPVFTADERRKVLDTMLPRLKVHDLTRKVIMLMSERSRLAALPQVSKVFTEMMDERAGRVRVSVSTVEPLTPSLEKELTAAFAQSTGKTVVLDARIDPTLIGGMVARIGGRVFDASIKSRLEDIKHRLINAPAAPEA